MISTVFKHTVIGAAAIAFSCGAWAQLPDAGAASAARASPSASAAAVSMPALSAADRRFIKTAAMGGMAEVSIAALAEKQASSPQVKEFAVRLVKDHSAVNSELKQLASSKDIQLPEKLDAAQQRQLGWLRQKQGTDFDHSFMRYTVRDHQKDIADFQTAASSSDAAVQSFAAKTLPTLQEHSTMAEGIHSALRASANAPGTASSAP
jgi:putative membrane protein